ncbi:hypothetical protein CDL12_16043 [Handroanthus impetiginosus]|uniref:Uncharacterized protein n=1 Tax=Handroanthus impetiginosus TaxID=429701 RepID=A0A2G9H1H3_9LAMI|nr:hypothetical protein CDL12_16043 [Handroanthus impetiginosus]
MEGDRKRKRGEKGEGSRDDDRVKTKGRAAEEDEEVAVDGASTPTEEEVEEFFAILRRMREAVKYFEKGASNNKGGADKPQVTPAVEAPPDSVEVAGERVVKKSRLDLNTIPEAESSLV